MTECGLHISLSIKPKMPTMVSGHLNSQRPTPINQVSSTTHTTCWLVITTTHLSVSMSQKVVITIHISITWSLLCPHNFMMVWLNTKMVLHPQPHKWLMMFLSILLISLDQRSQIKRLSLVWLVASSWLSTQFHTSSQSTIMSTPTLTDSRSTLSRVARDTRNSEKRCSSPTRSQVTGSEPTHELQREDTVFLFYLNNI